MSILQWWADKNTKLGIYINPFASNASSNLSTTANSPINGQTLSTGLDYTNGISATLNETYQYSKKITRLPVSSKMPISDTIITQPTIIHIEGLLSALTPISLTGGNNITGVNAGGLDFSKLGNAISILLKLKDTNTGLSLITNLLYGSAFFRIDNVVISDLRVDNNAEEGRTNIRFYMTIQEMRIVSQVGSSFNVGSNTSTAVPAAGTDFL